MDGELSDLQLAFMRVLWSREEASVQEVRDGLDDLGRALQPTTVATVLNRLEKRGLVSRRRDGRQFMYSALRSEATVRRSALSRVKDLVFGGDLKAMVAHLLDPAEVEADELAEVRRLIAAHDARRLAEGGDETSHAPTRSEDHSAASPPTDSQRGGRAPRRSDRED